MAKISGKTQLHLTSWLNEDPQEKKKAYKAVATKIQEDTTRFVTYDPKDSNKFQLYSKSIGTNKGAGKKPEKILETVTRDEIDGFCKLVDACYAEGGHRRILDDDDWKSFYDVKDDHVRVKFKDTWTNCNCKVIPCYYCGIVVPLDRIEIDHWYEQVGGEVGAMIKCFRGFDMGLTEDEGTGKKASAFKGNKLSAAVRTRNDGPTLDLRSLHVKNLNIRKNTKQDLSLKGLLVLSIAYAANKDFFFNFFMHSFFNLVPCCNACNKAMNKS